MAELTRISCRIFVINAAWKPALGRFLTGNAAMETTDVVMTTNRRCLVDYFEMKGEEKTIITFSERFDLGRCAVII